MSDRDKKIILFLMIIAVVALPYVFVIKEKRLDTQATLAGNVELQARLDYLEELDSQREFFIDETEENNKQRDRIVESFPADIRQENYTMFLLETEYSSAYQEPIEGTNQTKTAFEYPIIFDDILYGQNEITPISDGSEQNVSLELNTVMNSSTISYETKYDAFKHYLAYFMNYSDPMTYSYLTASFDPETGKITGQIVLDQFAISGTLNGEERVLPPVNIHPSINSLNLRGASAEKILEGFTEENIRSLQEEDLDGNIGIFGWTNLQADRINAIRIENNGGVVNAPAPAEEAVEAEN